MEVCKCGAKTKVFQENKVKGIECKECGRRYFSSIEEREQAKEVKDAGE